MLADLLGDYSIKIAVVATLLLFLFVGLAVFLENAKIKYSKKLLFIIILLISVLPTLFFIGSTVYKNVISSSGGPVHWHADIEIWACGEELDIINPTGFSNKVGTNTLHEHNDKKIHLEGVVIAPDDASLGNFFYVIGGTINDRVLAVPTDGGVMSYANGAKCPDGTAGSVQVFLYSTQDGVYTQEKIGTPERHIMAPYSQVPEGDCIIIEFGPEKETTDRLCRSYMVAEEIGKVRRAE